MKIKKVRILLVLILVFIFPQLVHASEKSVEAILPVEQVFKIEGLKPKKINTSVNYSLKRYSSDYPMPSQSFGDEFRLNIDPSKSDISWIFDKVGIYEYDIYTDMQDSPHYIYNKEHYTIKIAVNELQDGNLSSQIVVLDDKGIKHEKLIFRHKYIGKEKEKEGKKRVLPKTGDISNINMWIGIAIISVLLFIYLILKKYPENK